MSRDSRIGLQMYTMRRHMASRGEYRETLRRVAEIGYEVIQTTLPAFYTAEEYVAEMNEFGLCADSVYIPTGQICERIGEAARLAELFACDVLRTNSIPKELRNDADGYRTYAGQLNREGEACRQAGLRLIYHFHAFEWIRFGNERGIDIILKETDPELVYFQPDVFWLTAAGTEPSVSLKMFAGRAFSIHVKDYAILKLDGAVENVPYHYAPVGEGNLNWPGILKTAEEIGIRRFVVEQDECTGDAFEAIASSYRSLRAMSLK